jgi:hypothetical protein
VLLSIFEMEACSLHQVLISDGFTILINLIGINVSEALVFSKSQLER